ncbi:MAG: HAMP domain-containing protein [Deltaproteobacteria bacterium]|nr:HAMP domain-containing protein [Deltaproteobacteria bacterium]
MKRLFWRIFVLSWTAMILVGAGFSLFVAASYPTERMERRLQRFVSALGLQGEEILRVRSREGEDAAHALVEALASDLENDLWLVESGAVRLGSTTPPAGDLVQRLATQATAKGYREQAGAVEQVAVSLRTPEGAPSPWVLVAVNPRPAPLWRTLEREAQRLVLIVVVAGLLSLLLARYLSRPLSRLREASDRIARGDLKVRVTPALAGGSAEVMAVARDFDLMAERIEDLLESQRRLLRDVSHELRSPLARLGVALELARKRAGPEAEGALDRIERDSLRLGELISEILDLSRLETGTNAGEVEVVDLGALIAEVVDDVDFEAKGRGRSVTLTLDPAESLVTEARPELIRRAIENVLRNAARFAPDGTAVECTVRVLDDGGHRYAEVTSRDRGPGVPEAELAEIFRPFYRVETARDRNTGGAGIGLAIVERAVRIHGGVVRAENADGGGLRVIMRLPLGAAARTAVRLAA